MSLVDDIRWACARVAAHARFVRIDEKRLTEYARGLPELIEIQLDPNAHFVSGSTEERAAFVLTVDAINFGSGWFPTIRKLPGRSGYFTIATRLTERFERSGPWQAHELREIDAEEVASVLDQDREHELMALYANALQDLGSRVGEDFGGRFLSVTDAAGRSAVALAELLATWSSFADVSSYDGRPVPFCKRAQIAASDLAAAGVARFDDLDRLTLFADNLVPHVLRLDGVLRYDERLVDRIESGAVLEHGSPEEVEIRACAVHAVELIAEQRAVAPRELDYLLWNRGQEPSYKARPRHRSRCTAY